MGSLDLSSKLSSLGALSNPIRLNELILNQSASYSCCNMQLCCCIEGIWCTSSIAFSVTTALPSLLLLAAVAGTRKHGP